MDSCLSAIGSASEHHLVFDAESAKRYLGRWRAGGLLERQHVCGGRLAEHIVVRLASALRTSETVNSCPDGRWMARVTLPLSPTVAACCSSSSLPRAKPSAGSYARASGLLADACCAAGVSTRLALHPRAARPAPPTVAERASPSLGALDGPRARRERF